ncbi:MAG TPA: Crp/Fnr family transcriptional regulator [Mucilaginibacter sp.]
MKKTIKECDLKSCFLCASCIHDWLPAIAANKVNVSLKKGQELFKEGDAVEGIFFVFSGKVKVHKRWDNDKVLILRFAQDGDILGHLGLGDSPIYPISATAVEDTMVCFVKMDFFESSLNVNPQFTIKLMRVFANALQESEKRMRNLAHMPVKERIAQALLSLKEQFGLNEEGYIDIELTRQDVASYAGVVYETYFKVTQDFSQHNLIETNGKSIKLLDEEALSAVIQGS